jgi:hypothetical protein
MCKWLSILDKIETVFEDHGNLKTESVEILEGIYAWIESHEHCTDKQISIIKKIDKRGW